MKRLLDGGVRVGGGSGGSQGRAKAGALEIRPLRTVPRDPAGGDPAAEIQAEGGGLIACIARFLFCVQPSTTAEMRVGRIALALLYGRVWFSWTRPPDPYHKYL